MQARKARREIPSLVQEEQSLFAYKKYALRVNEKKKDDVRHPSERLMRREFSRGNLSYKDSPENQGLATTESAVSLEFID